MRRDVTKHPRYAEFMELYPGDTAPAKLSAEELDRLTPSEQAELLALLERRDAERAVDMRPPIQHLLFEAFFDNADKCKDPDDYLDRVLAHERCRRKHLQQIKSARPPQSEQDGPRPPLEELIAAWGADDDEATRRATKDGYPRPEITPPKQILAAEPLSSSEARRATLPRDVRLDLEETDARRGERDFFNRIASRQDDDRLLPYRDKSSGSSAEPPSYPDN